MARLNGGGVPQSVAITNTYVVAAVADLITLTNARIGDVGIVTGTNETYILAADPYTNPANWVELLSNSVIAGGAVAGNVAFFNNAYTIIGSNDFVYNDTTKNLSIGPSHIMSGNGNLVVGNTNAINTLGDYNIIAGQNNAVNSLSYNAIFGKGNVSQNSGYNIIAGEGNFIGGGWSAFFGKSNGVGGGPENYSMAFGLSNALGSGAYNLIGGQTNTLTGSAHSIVIGQNNSATGGVAATAIFGESNAINYGGYCIIAGRSNAVGYTGTAQPLYNAVFGLSQTVNDTQYGIVAGRANTMAVAATYNAVFGWGHNVSGNNHVVGGGYYDSVANGNIVSANANAVFGARNNVSGEGNLVQGGGNTGGWGNVVTGSLNIVVGRANTVAGLFGLVTGYGNTLGAAADTSFIIGRENNVNLQYGGVLGYQMSTSAGARAHAFAIGGRIDIQSSMTLGIGGYGKLLNDYSFVQAGGIQANVGERGTIQEEHILRYQITTDATPVEVYVSQGAAQLNTEDNKAYLCRVKVVARNQAAQQTAGFILDFVFDRGAGVATSRVSGVTKNVVHRDIVTWDVNVTADVVNGRPAIMVTGEALKNINWTAKIEMTEVG